MKKILVTEGTVFDSRFAAAETRDLAEGFRESFEWYRKHQGEVSGRNYISFIDNHF